MYTFIGKCNALLIASLLVLSMSVSAEVKVDAGPGGYAVTKRCFWKSVECGVGYSGQPDDTLGRRIQAFLSEREYPDPGCGFLNAPPALTEGTSNLGPMSRKMKDKEIAALRKSSATSPPRFRSQSMRWQSMCTRITRSRACPLPTWMRSFQHPQVRRQRGTDHLGRS